MEPLVSNQEVARQREKIQRALLACKRATGSPSGRTLSLKLQVLVMNDPLESGNILRDNGDCGGKS